MAGRKRHPQRVRYFVALPAAFMSAPDDSFDSVLMLSVPGDAALCDRALLRPLAEGFLIVSAVLSDRVVWGAETWLPA
jgi:hypothetical protein